MKRRWSRWLVGGAVLLVGYLAFGALGIEGGLAILLEVLVIIWVAITLAVATWTLWRWATYRVGVRLFMTYLLLGVTPFLLFGGFGLVTLYVLMGQYTSVRFGDLMDARLAVVQGRCESLLATARVEGAEAAVGRLRGLESAPMAGLPSVLWVARFGDTSYRSDRAAELPIIDWIEPPVVNAIARHGDLVFAIVGVAGLSGTNRVVALVPLDEETARAVSEESWFQVAFTVVDGGTDDDQEAHVGAEYGPSGVKISADVGGLGAEALWSPWPAEASGRFTDRPLVFWLRMARDVRNLETGELLGAPSAVSLLRTSPANVWDDFVLSRYELSTGLRGALAGMAVFFGLLYAIALLMAATMIVFITRSTSRLSHGAAEVGKGNLDYRIRVTRRDQLGDLAASFNAMADSVQDMLRQVADRERLARELELAREIQESLLPDRHLRHGPFTVHATFRPATEVGGDYFDIFPLSEGRLVVVIGDVAGHGLHTGLLMASLKSSVAALIHEGYTGPGLVQRVNRLMIDQRSSRTIATLTVVEIDPAAEHVHITNAGHPPAFLLTMDASEELLAGSIPIGSALCRPSELDRPFPASGLLVLYSDGLPEALGPNGEPYGYERLAEVLGECRSFSGVELTATILGDLERYVAGSPLADDLTLVVVESGSASAPDGSTPDRTEPA